ncbi:MAG: M20/M25/M40 family metallo-hydrolase [Lewinellaceae bacterium]|nr:M20/M25/M40 family metallo-hydrolase [Phaeodactylibacter sp.]MCB9040165.1 M20/M25/M40 family metallo-hydrolase [Lewinellaceae bacterium]
MKRFAFLILLFSPLLGAAQEEALAEDAFFIRRIYDEALTRSRCYDWLNFLAQRIGGRLAGSPQAAAAVEYTRQALDAMQLDSVWLQPCMVPHWVRGEKEQVRIVNSLKMGTVELNALALGNSVGTGPMGITAEVVEVKSLDQADSLGEFLRNKIVFFNGPMDPTQLNTFNAYGKAAGQRVWGASRASRYGALGVLARSLTTRLDDIPHTGSTVYEEGITPIPAFAISTRDAELLSRLLQEEPLRVFLRNTSQNLGEAPSFNVIGEIRGSEFPEEIILVGGHLDSWDVGSGAHDDGAGCVHAMEVLHLIRRMGYRPKRTIRCVLFMNEENGLRGARAYWKWSDDRGEYHAAAIESDRGGFTPRGFTADGHEEVFNDKFRKAVEWLPLLEPYGLSLRKGGSGADISGLKGQKGLLFGLEPDSQRYFDYHHTPIDGLDVVNKRELELGAAAIMSLVYLLDKYGI